MQGSAPDVPCANSKHWVQGARRDTDIERSYTMAKHTETYENCAIEIDDDDKLRIEGKDINYEYDAISNKWSANYLPYTQYDSLLELARAIARDTVEFVEPEDQE